MTSFDGGYQSVKHQHDHYEIKKVGKFWIMKVNGQHLRIRFLDHAKEVYIEENFLIADDDIFEIKKKECGELSFQKVEDYLHEPKEYEHSSEDLPSKQNEDVFEVGNTEIDKALDTESNDNNSNKHYKEENCVICMDLISDPKKLKCGHSFCTECLELQLKFKPACPTCGQICGILTGDQPEGHMTHTVDRFSDCNGYKWCGKIIITYSFPSGKQGDDHPNPGAFYQGITRTAYLPNNTEGRKILAMLYVAFERKLVFTIGNSRTTGQEGVITWNDIHHKTNPKPHQQYGYPDPGYLERVKEELAAKGVTENDIQD